MAFTERHPGYGPPPVSHTVAGEAAEELLALREENRQLKEGIVAHARIDQAMGVLIALGGITPDDAWDVLREVSMNTNTQLRMVAAALVAQPVGGALSEDVREALESALAEHRRPSMSTSASPQRVRRPT